MSNGPTNPCNPDGSCVEGGCTCYPANRKPPVELKVNRWMRDHETRELVRVYDLDSAFVYYRNNEVCGQVATDRVRQVFEVLERKP